MRHPDNSGQLSWTEKMYLMRVPTVMLDLKGIPSRRASKLVRGENNPFGQGPIPLITVLVLIPEPLHSPSMNWIRPSCESISPITASTDILAGQLGFGWLFPVSSKSKPDF